MVFASYFSSSPVVAPGSPSPAAHPGLAKPGEAATATATTTFATHYSKAYWTQKRRSIYSTFTSPAKDPDAFPSNTEVVILDELFEKLSKQLTKDDRRSHRHHESHTMKARPRTSRSSSCSSSSSIATAVNTPTDPAAELHTTCLLLGQHVNQMAINATYWDWSHSVFANLAELYAQERTRSDSRVKMFVLATTCLLACQMCKTLSSASTVTSECMDAPPLTKTEREQVNNFLRDKVLDYVLYLVEMEGNEGHHIAGETVSFLLAHITPTPAGLRRFFESSRREKLFSYPRFRHLRIWRYMWLKVVFERLAFIREQVSAAPTSPVTSASSTSSAYSLSLGNSASTKAALPSASQLTNMEKITTDELFSSFANEQDDYVRDHSELLFDCTLAPSDRPAFVYKSTEPKTGAFLLGLNGSIANLCTSQQMILTS